MTKMSGTTPKPWVKSWRGGSARWQSLPLTTRGLARELWTHADDHGRIELPPDENPKTALWRLVGAHPRERQTLAAHLDALAANGTVTVQPGLIFFPNFVSYNQPPTASDESKAQAGHKQDASKAQVERKQGASQKRPKPPKPLGPNPQEGEGEEEVEEDRDPGSLSLGLVAVPEPDPVLVLFDFWRGAVGARKALLDDKRRKRLRWALEHYTLEDCKRACTGLALSDWHMGKDPKTRGATYKDVSNVFKDAAQVERWLEVEAKGARVGGGGRLECGDGGGWDEGPIVADDDRPRRLGHG